MNNADFWTESWFINDFHRKNCIAALREVQQLSLHPCSWEKKLAQIARIHQHSANTKDIAKTVPDMCLSDMHDENVIHSNKSNTIFVVDCDIRINTPELRQGGIRQISKNSRCGIKKNPSAKMKGYSLISIRIILTN